MGTCRAQFGKLGQMIESHPRLKQHSRFLFIPGPEDAGNKNICSDLKCVDLVAKALRKSTSAFFQVPQQFYLDVLCQDISQKSFRITYQMQYFRATLAGCF